MNKLKKVLFIVMVFYTNVLFSQYFEGTLTYKIEPQNPNPKVISDSSFYNHIKASFNGRLYLLQKYHYKNNKYKSVVEIGESKTFQLYVSSEKRLYSWQSISDSATWVSSEINTDQIKGIKHLEEEEVVFDIKCKKVIILSEYGETTYWYNPTKFKINYELYKTHSYGNWNKYIEVTGVLPLKFELRGKTMHLITTATEVKEEKVFDTVFELPKLRLVKQN